MVAFLVLTALFAGEAGLVSTETDSTDSSTEDLPEQQALDAVNEEFEPPFEPDLACERSSPQASARAFS